jgi:hypothetical protein
MAKNKRGAPAFRGAKNARGGRGGRGAFRGGGSYSSTLPRVNFVREETGTDHLEAQCAHAEMTWTLT